jgi:hypothetical protein
MVLEDPGFWAMVAKGGPDDCWLWQGWKRKDGYGEVIRSLNGKRKVYRTHRYAYIVTFGDPGELDVCHRCDERYPRGDITYRACCNPQHFWTGTHAENMEDRNRKGRQDRSQAELAAPALFTNEQIRVLRRIYATGAVTQKDLAVICGVNPVTISMIVNRKNWDYEGL